MIRYFQDENIIFWNFFNMFFIIEGPIIYFFDRRSPSSNKQFLFLFWQKKIALSRLLYIKRSKSRRIQNLFLDLFDYLRALCVVAHTVGSKVFDLIIIAVDPWGGHLKLTTSRQDRTEHTCPPSWLSFSFFCEFWRKLHM